MNSVAPITACTAGAVGRNENGPTNGTCNASIHKRCEDPSSVPVGSGQPNAYLDSARSPGVMIQLMASNPVITELFDLVRAGADTWDGSTNPVRRLDWSTGRPRLAD